MSVRNHSLLKGVETGFPLVFSAAFFGIIFGFTGGSGGLPLHFVSAMSWVIFAGSAQFITLILIIENELLAAIVITGVLINLRHLLYGAVLHSLIRFKGFKRLFLAYLLTDEAFLVTTLVEKEQRELQNKPFQLDYVLIGSGVLLWISWNVMTIVGYFVYQYSSNLISLPENFVISASFVGFLIQQWVKFPEDRLLMTIVTALSIIMGSFATSSIILISLMIAGATFAMVEKFIRSRRGES